MAIDFKRGGERFEAWLKRPWNRSFLRLSRRMGGRAGVQYKDGTNLFMVIRWQNLGTKYIKATHFLDRAMARYRREAPALVERTLKARPNITPRQLDLVLRRFGTRLVKASVRKFGLIRTGRLLRNVGMWQA